VIEQFGGEFVEQLMQLEELLPLHVPVRLFRLAVKVEGVGQLLVQQRDDLFARLGVEVDAGFVHFQFIHFLPLFSFAVFTMT